MIAVELQEYSFTYASVSDAASSEGAANVEGAPSAEGAPAAAAAPAEKTLDNVSFCVEEGIFAVVCGRTGSGKTTLLRALKPELAPVGTHTGSLRLFERDPQVLDSRDSAAMVGFVMQNPQHQLVMDTVWHELAFGLENLGTPQPLMRRRVAETAHFFGIGAWFDKRVSELSGGQQQILNLAAVVAMQPLVLVLDEPTAQLDPIATKDFLQVLARVNTELGITVIVCEHNLEEVLPLADTILFLERGKLVANCTPREFAMRLLSDEDPFVAAMPAASQVVGLLTSKYPHELPLTVKEGRAWLTQWAAERANAGHPVNAFDADVHTMNAHDASCKNASLLDARGVHRESAPLLGARDASCKNASLPEACNASCKSTPLLEARDVWYRYSKQDDFVLRGLSLAVHAGEVKAVVGGNGCGKSTLLFTLGGAYKPTRGSVRLAQGVRTAVLAQDPHTLFVCDTLREDLEEWQERFGYSACDIDAMMERLGLTALAEQHPFDLSGGELQKAALAKVLLLEPQVLLLDEPTKGIDIIAKQEIAIIVRELADAGRAVLIVSHDLDFVATVADSCAMIFDGVITCEEAAHDFFLGNMFFTTGVNRVTHAIVGGCVTLEDVARAETPSPLEAPSQPEAPLPLEAPHA